MIALFDLCDTAVIGLPSGSRIFSMIYTIAHISRVGPVLCRSCTKPLPTAGEGVDGLLTVDHDLYDRSADDLFEVCKVDTFDGPTGQLLQIVQW